MSEDLYTKANHFFLELIQNADDNRYSAGVVPTLRIRVDAEQDQILVECNETGFTEANVRALCAIGDSTKKKKDVLGYIGM